MWPLLVVSLDRLIGVIDQLVLVDSFDIHDPCYLKLVVLIVLTIETVDWWNQRCSEPMVDQPVDS